MSHRANPNCHMSSIEHATHHKEKVMLPDQCKGCECPPEEKFVEVETTYDKNGDVAKVVANGVVLTPSLP